MPKNRPLVYICSVELEAAPLRARMGDVEEGRIGRKPSWRGRVDGHPAVLVVGGMGKTNAAQALAAALEHEAAVGVIGFGVGGAYAGSGLAIADVVVASAEIYGDEGVQTPTGWISTEGIGIPLLEHGGRRTFNHFTLSGELVDRAARLIGAGGAGVHRGLFLTLSTCSGTSARGAELVQRFGAVCETMEGAAYAHVAAIYETPYLELRGISNHVEDRDLSGWRLREAAEAAADAAVRAAGAFQHAG